MKRSFCGSYMMKHKPIRLENKYACTVRWLSVRFQLLLVQLPTLLFGCHSFVCVISVTVGSLPAFVPSHWLIFRS